MKTYKIEFIPLDLTEFNQFKSECDEDDDYDPNDDFWDNYDYCYECTGYGDDYYFDEDGELQSACETCPHNPLNDDWND